MDMNEAVAKAISAERGAAGMTIKELAEKSGVPERTLIRLLKAERDIKVDQLAALADVFGITPAALIAEAQKYQKREEAQKAASDNAIGDAMAKLARVTGYRADYTTASYHDKNKDAESEDGQ